MAASKHDLAHFEAIGRAMAAEKLADCAQAAQSSPAERVRAGFLLGDVPRSSAIDAALDSDALGQLGLARRRPVQEK